MEEIKYGLSCFDSMETLDPKILQKAINSGSNYRTYCDEKSWDISFEIEFLEKEEIIFLLLVEHGRRKGGTSVQKTNERTETSKYTKEEQAKMVNAFNQKLDTYETWNSRLSEPTTSMFGNHVDEILYGLYVFLGSLWATEFFCPIIMNVNYILCNPIPMLQ